MKADPATKRRPGRTKRKRFFLEFECENAVFADYPADAVADALLAVSKQVRREGLLPNSVKAVRDTNGNSIGAFKYEARDA